MSRKSAAQIPMALPDDRHCSVEWLQLHKIILDRGSHYSVTGGQVLDRASLKQFLKKVKKNRKYASATHNSWAARVSRDGGIFETKSDDGETGAGQVILHQLRKQKIVDAIVVVTRWYGGIKLQSDRYKHVQDATIFWIQKSIEG